MCSNSKENVGMEATKPTTYQKTVRREYGVIHSVDVTFRLLREFLEARQVIEWGPMPILDDEEANKANMERYEKKVKPFFDHMSEILDTI